MHIYIDQIRMARVGLNHNRARAGNNAISHCPRGIEHFQSACVHLGHHVKEIAYIHWSYSHGSHETQRVHNEEVVTETYVHSCHFPSNVGPETSNPHNAIETTGQTSIHDSNLNAM